MNDGTKLGKWGREMLFYPHIMQMRKQHFNAKKSGSKPGSQISRSQMRI
jgi:hypothetical protein